MPVSMIEKTLYGLSDFAAAEAAGVIRLRRQPYLKLTGRGIIFGIADTGIDYTHPVFRFPDGRSRILAIWDQTAEPDGTGNVSFGRIYTQEELNTALLSTEPLQIVPENDVIGHGTFLAGIAAGNEVPEEDFTGMAPNALLLVVKLRQADNALKKFWFISRETPAYEESDLLHAVRFLESYADELGAPLTVLLGVGSSLGNHSGLGIFQTYLNFLTTTAGRAAVLSGGNEGNAAHHFQSISYEGILYQDVELRISDVKEGTFLEFWANAPDLYGIGFISPTGELIEKLPTRTEFQQTISFVFEPTVIDVRYERTEAVTGATRIRIRMENPTNGIWKIRIYQLEVHRGRFDLWLPISAFIQGNAVFLKPEPDTTITEPGNAGRCMTVTAYSMETNGIFLESSRGFTSDGKVKPDFVAPGVNIRGPIRGGLYTGRSGSSIAAALTAGLSVLMQEYNPRYTGVQIKNLFIRGAVRGNGTYPNTEMGWGRVNIYDTLENLRVQI